jgi:hypothetical protein
MKFDKIAHNKGMHAVLPMRSRLHIPRGQGRPIAIIIVSAIVLYYVLREP